MQQQQTRHRRGPMQLQAHQISYSFWGPAMTCCGPGHGGPRSHRGPNDRRRPYPCPAPPPPAVSVAACSDGAIVAGDGLTRDGRDVRPRPGVRMAWEGDGRVQIRSPLSLGGEVVHLVSPMMGMYPTAGILVSKKYRPPSIARRIGRPFCIQSPYTLYKHLAS